MKHEEVIDYLNSHHGEIREVALALASSWLLGFRPDGSASIKLPGQFDAIALTPPDRVPAPCRPTNRSPATRSVESDSDLRLQSNRP